MSLESFPQNKVSSFFIVQIKSQLAAFSRSQQANLRN